MKSIASDTPLISVIMPVFNAKAYLAEAIESILSQSYSNFEFLIIDDGSTDGSLKIIQRYACRDTRIRCLNLEHKGAGGAANAGIAAASGDYIARMDADDIALPERFATQLSWITTTGVDICGSCVKTFGVEHRIMWFPETHEAIRAEMLFRCALMQPTVMLRADIAKKHPYNENLYFEDYELWTRLAPRYRMGNVPQILLKYRTHTRQRHIVHATDVRNELRGYCRIYCHTLFQEIAAEDESIISRIVCNEPLENLAELKRGGELLTQLAGVDDLLLRRRMAQRWIESCRLSAFLGIATYRCFRKAIPNFGIKSDKLPALWLALASILRLQPDSKMERQIKSLKRFIRI